MGLYHVVEHTLASYHHSGRNCYGGVVFEIPQSDVPYELRYDDGNSNVTIGVESDPTQAPYLPILRPGSPR